MITHRKLIILSMLLLVGMTYSANSQTTPSAEQPSITVNIRIEMVSSHQHKEPFVILTVVNVSQQPLCFSTGMSSYIINVLGKDGAPPMTEMHRHLHGEFRPGDRPDLPEGPVICKILDVGESNVMKYDISDFYDLAAPGAYSVFMRIRDPLARQGGPGLWLQTNTVQFEIANQS